MGEGVRVRGRVRVRVRVRVVQASLLQRGAALSAIGLGWCARHGPAVKRARDLAGLVVGTLELHTRYHREACSRVRVRVNGEGEGEG